MEYIAYLHKDAYSDFGVSFPDFPGCVTAGKTLDEARRLAGEALALHLDGMIEDCEDIPEPSTLDDLADDPVMKGAVAFLMTPNALSTLAPAETTARINITGRKRDIQTIDRLADEAGLTRSAYMVHASLGALQSKREVRKSR